MDGVWIHAVGEGLIEDVAVEGEGPASSRAQSSPGSFLAAGVGMFEGSNIWGVESACFPKRIQSTSILLAGKSDTAI